MTNPAKNPERVWGSGGVLWQFAAYNKLKISENYDVIRLFILISEKTKVHRPNPFGA
jgi:hypothetical protein